MDAIFEVLDSIEALVSLLLMFGLLWIWTKFIALLLGGLIVYFNSYRAFILDTFIRLWEGLVFTSISNRLFSMEN